MQSGPSTNRSAVHWSRKSNVPDYEDDDDAASDSSSDVTEDEEGTDLTPALDAAILRTLGKIRRGEGVYEGENVLETELEQAKAEALRRGVIARQTRVESKPYLLADHHRSALLEGRVDEEAEEEENRWRPIPYAQEQRRLRKEAIEAFSAIPADDEGEDEGFVPVKKEEGAGGVKEDEEYRQFLLEMGGGEEEVRRLLGMGDQAVSFVRADADDVSDPEAVEDAEGTVKKVKKESDKKIKKRMEKKAKDDDEFLMNFILNRGWVDKADGGDHNYADFSLDAPRPTSQVKESLEVDDDEEEGVKAGPSHPWGLLDEDEFDEKADEFETGYNFRFEEPGATEISTHPRVIPSLVRRPDDKRILKRAARAERKALADQAREEEARKTKGKKRREMDSQMAALRKEVGEKEWAKIEEVMEGEYDESTWERVVGGLLSGAIGGGDDDDDDEKPTWDDDDDFNYGDEEEEEGGEDDYPVEEEVEEDAPINMDADFIGLEPEKKKKSKKDKKGKEKKDDQSDNKAEDGGLTVEQRAEKLKAAMEEYKALDHEDMIGDLPTRFHYTQAPAQDYGLTPAEILLATDAELNQIMSVKHLAPYRNTGLGTAAKGLGKRVKDLKDQVKERRWGEETVIKREDSNKGPGGRERDGGWPKRENNGEGGPRKKRMGKNERKRKMGATVDGGEGATGADSGNKGSSGQNQGDIAGTSASAGPPDRARADSEAPKKRRKKNKNSAGAAQAA